MCFLLWKYQLKLKTSLSVLNFHLYIICIYKRALTLSKFQQTFVNIKKWALCLPQVIDLYSIQNHCHKKMHIGVCYQNHCLQNTFINYHILNHLIANIIIRWSFSCVYSYLNLKIPYFVKASQSMQIHYINLTRFHCKIKYCNIIVPNITQWLLSFRFSYASLLFSFLLDTTISTKQHTLISLPILKKYFDEKQH